MDISNVFNGVKTGKITGDHTLTIYNNIEYSGRDGLETYQKKLAAVEYVNYIKDLSLTMPKCVSKREKEMNLTKMNPGMKDIIESAIKDNQRIPFELPIVIKPYSNSEARYDIGNIKIDIEYYIYETKDGVICVKSETTSEYASGDLWKKLSVKCDVVDWTVAAKKIKEYGIDIDASKKNMEQPIYELLETRSYNGFRGLLKRLRNIIVNVREGR